VPWGTNAPPVGATVAVRVVASPSPTAVGVSTVVRVGTGATDTVAAALAGTPARPRRVQVPAAVGTQRIVASPWASSAAVSCPWGAVPSERSSVTC
jgi:hypothetical protein